MSCSPLPPTEQLNPASLPATPLYDPVGIFWDYENCRPSTNASGYNIVDSLRALASQSGAVNTFKAYLQLPDKSSPKQSALRSEFQSCGLSLTDCPHTGKNSVDLMMIVDIMAFIKDNPAPATIILISGDRDFAYLLSTVRWRKYNVVLICNSFMTHESLTAQASVVYDWQSDILKARPSSKPPLLRGRRETSSSVAPHTTPQESDGLPESDARAVGLPSEHITLAIQPPAPPPPASITTNTIRPRHVTSPSDVLSVESAVTPMPPKPEIPTGTALASIPMSPTSDDRIVIDLESASPMEESSSETTDPDEEDGFHSPAFSSPEMVPSKGRGDIPSPPGRLLLIDEESLPEHSVHDVGDTDSGTIKPLLGACDCKTCMRASDLPESQALAHGTPGSHQVEPTHREPSALLPTEVAQPPESLPIQKIPSNAPALTFIPRIPHLPPAETSRPPTKPDLKRDFGDLIVVLGELSANGNPAPQFLTIYSALRDRKPDMFKAVGVTKFVAYLRMAESIGIVTIEQYQDGDGRVTLRRQWNASPDTPLRRDLPQHPLSRFLDLIRILNDPRLPEPRFSTVAPRLLRENPSIYENPGVTKFEEYIEAAAEAGVVAVRGSRNGDGWLELSPAYCSLLPPHSTPTSPTVAPPTRAVSTDPTFAPLVDFLKSKQLTSARPVPFSDIFVHLNSTLGYPGLFSLCASIPGVTNFGRYINAAIASGHVSLVSGTIASRDALISLPGVRSQLPSSISPTTPQRSPFEPLSRSRTKLWHRDELEPINATTSQRHPFEPLIRSLTKLWYEGKPEPTLSELHPLVLAQDIAAYDRVGAMNIKDYVTKAATAKIVIYNLIMKPGVSSMSSTVRLRKPPSQFPDGPSVPSPRPSPLPSTKDITVSPPPVKITVTPASFQDLVTVMTELRASTGEPESRFSTVVSLLLKRRPNACASVGVASLTDYVILAIDHGVVRIRGMEQFEGDGWVSLSDPGPERLKSPSSVSLQSSKSPKEGPGTARSSLVGSKGGGVDPKFVDLVETLGEVWKSGETKPHFSLVGSLLLKDEGRKTRTLVACGVPKFKAYVELAKDAGIVEVYYGRPGEERMSLDPTIRVKAGYI